MRGTPPRHVELFDELPDAAIEAAERTDRRDPPPGRRDRGARAWHGTDRRPRDPPLADAHVPGLAPHATGGRS